MLGGSVCGGGTLMVLVAVSGVIGGLGGDWVCRHFGWNGLWAIPIAFLVALPVFVLTLIVDARLGTAREKGEPAAENDTEEPK